MNQFDQFQEDPLVRKIVNLLTKNGKKSKSEKILIKIFFFIQANYPGQVLRIFYLAIYNSQLFVGIRLKSKGKKYRRSTGSKDSFVPYFIKSNKSQTLAIRSILGVGKQGNSFLNVWENLSQELLDASLIKGETLYHRYNVHNLSGLNRRYYRYRWNRKVPIDLDSLLLLEDKVGFRFFSEKRKDILRLKKIHDMCFF
ncbi:unnamed protein product [Dictyota dichotoma]|uniref:Ribosomal protein S7 n=1 Tax=Dictyota dichotoma TaxID=2876 RepID=Q2TUC5_DICDH|nr:ribosomal protein S7 [Dictyota dichotoma]AAS79070.1 ribosomal protein S7 [Dictyota dichotoma]